MNLRLFNASGELRFPESLFGTKGDKLGKGRPSAVPRGRGAAGHRLPALAIGAPMGAGESAPVGALVWAEEGVVWFQRIDARGQPAGESVTLNTASDPAGLATGAPRIAVGSAGTYLCAWPTGGGVDVCVLGREARTRAVDGRRRPAARRVRGRARGLVDAGADSSRCRAAPPLGARRPRSRGSRSLRGRGSLGRRGPLRARCQRARRHGDVRPAPGVRAAPALARRGGFGARARSGAGCGAHFRAGRRARIQARCARGHRRCADPGCLDRGTAPCTDVYYRVFDADLEGGEIARWNRDRASSDQLHPPSPPAATLPWLRGPTRAVEAR